MLWVLIGDSNGFSIKTYEPHHEKTCFCHMRTTKGAGQPAHLRSLISAFVIPCIGSIISVVSICKNISLVAITQQAGLSLPWSQNPKTGFLVTRFICCGYS